MFTISPSLKPGDKNMISLSLAEFADSTVSVYIGINPQYWESPYWMLQNEGSDQSMAVTVCHSSSDFVMLNKLRCHAHF